MRARHTRRSPGRGSPLARLRLPAALLISIMLLLPQVAVAADDAQLQATPYKVDLKPISQTVVAGGRAELTATVTKNGQPAGGEIVQLVNNSGTEPGMVQTTTTTPGGVATLSYSKTSSSTEPDQLVAVVQSSNPELKATSNTAYVFWIEKKVSKLVLSPALVTLPTGTTHEVTATATDINDDPVPGVEVDFTADGAGRQITDTVDTDQNGKAVFRFTRNARGTDTISAESQGVDATDVKVQWFVSPATIAISPEDATGVVNSTVTLTVTLEDRFGDPVPNTTIKFSVSGRSVDDEEVTNSNGEAAFTYRGIRSGTDTVTVYADFNNSDNRTSNEPQTTTTVTWVSGSDLTLEPASGSALTGTSRTFTATLEDQDGDPVPNVTIRFSTSGANSKTGSDTTDGDGEATFSYIGANAGDDTVTAYADIDGDNRKDANEPSATAEVTWSTASLALAPSSQSVDTGKSASLTATLQRGDGAINGVAIRYSVSGATSTSGSDTTDGDGKATFSYTGNTAGSDTVTAYADLDGDGVKDDNEPSATATVTWTTPPVFQPALPVGPKAGCTYFPETGHNLCGGFRQYWEHYGGLAIFGMPLTEEFVEDGLTVQYFERQRFEWHPGEWPERWDVMLGLLGSELTKDRHDEAPFQRTTAKTDPSCVYYAATGHNLCAGFRAYWEMYGGLAIYGFPISEEFVEKNPDTGQRYTVQYFERARVEWHPGEWPERFDTMLGRLGAQILFLRHGVPIQ